MVYLSSHGPYGVSATQVVAKRQLKMHLRKIREREYSKLRELIPSVASKKKVSKVEVIEEAVRYIEELHEALMERFRQKHGHLAKDKAQETMQIFLDQMANQSTSSSSQQTSSSPLTSLSQNRILGGHGLARLQSRTNNNNFEKQKTSPSFLLRKSRKE